SLDHAAVMTEHLGLDFLGVLDHETDPAVRGAELARVADLPARLCIERSVVEHDDAVLARLELRHGYAVSVDGQYTRALDRKLLVASKRSAFARVIEPGGSAELAGRARLLALAVHRDFEAFLVDDDAALAADV